MPRTTKSHGRTQDNGVNVDAIVAAVLAQIGQVQDAPATKPQAKRNGATGQARTVTKRQANVPTKRRRDPDQPATSKQVLALFFRLFELHYGEPFQGWPTSGDVEAIRADLGMVVD